MVYFSFTISTDCDPETLCRDLGMEWGRQNGDRLVVKEVQCHSTITPNMFFRLWHDGPSNGLIEELKVILTESWKAGRLAGDDSLPSNLVLPEMTFCGADAKGSEHSCFRLQHSILHSGQSKGVASGNRTVPGGDRKIPGTAQQTSGML